MKIEGKSKRLLLIGVIGCLLYVIDDFLFAATGKVQTTESIGFMVRVAYLEMGTWRMAASILCGFVGTLLPATVIFLAFFLLAAVVQIRAFSKGHAPLPRRCWVFSVLFGFVFAVMMRMIGNYGLTNAFATGWISIGNLWMMSGLLVASRKVSE